MTGRYSPHPDVVFKRLEDRMVLFHVATNRVFEFNDTAARVWELLQNGITGDALIDRLTDEFEVDPTTLRNEIEALLAELVSQGLIAS